MDPDCEFLTLECKVTGGSAMWKITLKPAAFEMLSFTNPSSSTIPARPFSYEDEDLLKVIKHMERVVGQVPGPVSHVSTKA